MEWRNNRIGGVIMAESQICNIIFNYSIATDIYIMAIESKYIANTGKPGQFIHIEIPYDNSLLLRRPISINSVDKKNNVVYIVYQVVGTGTTILSNLNKGDTLDILGPLGNGFLIPKDVNSIAIVGGGCGIAPLKYIVDYWRNISYTTFLGYKNIDSIYQLMEFERASERLYLTTDDGSQGEKGVITEIVKREIDDISPQLIIACGPIPMLREVQNIASTRNIPCQISLEERMGCGIGACMVCSCKVKAKDRFEYKKVCSDGPVFLGDEVILDENAQFSC